MSDVADWQDRAEALRDELVSVGKLASPELQSAVLSVPRHVFVPAFYERHPGEGWEELSGRDDATRERWWAKMYTNTSLVTQVGAISNGGRDSIGPTSSSSAPGLMTRMLEMLDLSDGQRLLEIGTGTGYNLALLCHRLGDQQVYSVDVDSELVKSAQSRLGLLGYHPAVVAVDGAGGLPDHAPYDRILATCAVSWIPWSWAEQTVDGGLVLADVKVHAAVGNLVLLRRSLDHLEGRFDTGNATFMHMRTEEMETSRAAQPIRDRDFAARRATQSTLDRLWENGPLWFLLHLTEFGRLDFGYTMDPETGGPDALFFTSPDGSWCEVSPVCGHSGQRDVWEAGPRHLWAKIEAISQVWEEEGQPGWDRFGLTVTRDEQVVWLDDPQGPHRWVLPRLT